MLPQDNPPDNLIAQALHTDNSGHEVPDEVWSYVKAQGTISALAETFTPVPSAKGPWLSCHLRGAPAEKKSLNRERAIGAVNNTVLQMNRDLKDLSNVVLRDVESNRGQK